MAVGREGNEVTVTGAEASLANLDVKASSLGQGATKIDVGSNPVRRVIIIKTAKLIIVGTGNENATESSLAWDPVQETLYISDDSPSGTGEIDDSNARAGAGGAIEVRKGGFLNIGTSTAGTDGTSYSAGDAVVIAKRGSGNSDIATGSICAEAGSKVHLKGCSISLAGSSRFDGANTIASRPADERATTGCELRINDVVIRVQRGSSYLAPRIYTDDYQIDGLHQIGEPSRYRTANSDRRIHWTILTSGTSPSIRWRGALHCRKQLWHGHHNLPDRRRDGRPQQR